MSSDKVNEAKSQNKNQELAEDMQKWYNSNKTVNTQKEFISSWYKLNE